MARKKLTNEQLRAKLTEGYDPLHMFLDEDLTNDQIEDPQVLVYWQRMAEFAYEAIRMSMRVETELQRAEV